MHEDMKPEPEDPYGISKYAVEMDLIAARRLFGLNYIIFRPHNVYGPNMGWEHVVPHFAARLAELHNLLR